MKNFQSAIILVLIAVSAVCVWALTQKPAGRVEKIEETSLFLVSVQEHKDGKIKKLFRLQNQHGNVIVDWVNDDLGNPFIHCRGLVFIGKKRGETELFDCRKTPFSPILTHLYLDRHGYVLEDIRPHYNNENSVVIVLRQKGVDGFLGKHLLSYNLKTKQLTSLLN